MAKIVDPDQINDATEVVYNTTLLEVQYLVAGNLDDNSPGKSSGVTGQAAYSASKDHILASASLRRHRSPYDPVFDASFLLKDGWDFADQQSIDLIRDAGIRVTATGQELACVIGLQSAGAADQLYYQQVLGFASATTDFDKTGDLNELIEIFDGAASDRRDFLKVYNRIEGKAYSEGNLLVDQDLAALTFIAYRLPLGNADDPNNNTPDATIDASSPYTGMSLSFVQGSGFTTFADSTVYVAGAVVFDPAVQSGGSANGTWWYTPAGGTSSGANTGVDVGVTDWESFAGERQIGDEWFAYNRIIAGNSGTDIQVHEWAKRQLRQVGDINADALGSPNQDAFGIVNGEVARLLTQIIGGMSTFGGVFIDAFDPNSRATAEFNDITVDGGGLDVESVPVSTTGRTFPFSSAGNMVFSENGVLETNGNTFFDMYFKYTRRDTATDVAITSAATNTCTLTSTLIDLSIYVATDWVELSGWANGENNGVFRATGTPTANSMDLVKIREPATVLVDESAGPTINVDDDPFNTDDAIIVNDDTGTPITGQITQTSEPFTFAYDTNVQGGRVAGTDATVVVVGQGLDDAKWGEAQFPLTRSVGLSYPVNLLDESVYNNP